MYRNHWYSIGGIALGATIAIGLMWHFWCADKESLLDLVEHQRSIIKLEQARLGVCMSQVDSAESSFAEPFGMIDGQVVRMDMIMKFVDGESRWFVIDIKGKGKDHE